VISSADYHANGALGSTMLKDALRSGHHYWMKWENPDAPEPEEKPYFRRGEIIHCAVLEPGRFYDTYKVCGPRNTKAGKEEERAIKAEGLEPITQSEWVQAISVVAAIQENADARRLLQEGKAEQSFFWNDLETDLRCKCRPDWHDGASVIVDLKTTSSLASPSEFARTVANFKYHLSAAHYLEGVKGAERFIFLVVETEYPYNVATYELDDDSLAEGLKLQQKALRRIKAWRQMDPPWPGYSQGVETIRLPEWAFTTNPVFL